MQQNKQRNTPENEVLPPSPPKDHQAGKTEAIGDIFQSDCHDRALIAPVHSLSVK